MTEKRFVGTALALAGLLMLASCGSTRLQSQWKDEAAAGYRIEKLFVIGISDKERIRKDFEDEFVRRFRENGIEASPSYPVLGAGVKPDKNMVRAAVAGKGYDTVLVTRLVGLDKKTMHVRGTPYAVPHAYYDSFYRYYGIAHEQSFSMVYDIVKLETNLYEVESEKLLYTILSESFDSGKIDDVLKPLSKALVKRLKRDGLL